MNDPERNNAAPDIAPSQAAPDPEPPVSPRCPNCGWQDVRPSHSRRLMDLLLAGLLLTPYRCRSCGRRFYRSRRQ